jgi:DNA-binding NarL/FixJ family response regulator
MHGPVQEAESRRETAAVKKKESSGTSGDADSIGTEVAGEATTIVIIERRALTRECLARCLEAVLGQTVLSFSTVEDWHESSDTVSASVILLGIAGELRAGESRHQIASLMQAANLPPIVILADGEDPDQIVEMLHAGVRGYIPTSLPLDVTIEAMRLVRAGGIFAPASSLIGARRPRESPHSKRLVGNGMFTARQAAVVEALRRGKANKIIAYELNMSESTVKVHVRNIMKKLKAKNRTEVAFMTNGINDDCCI